VPQIRSTPFTVLVSACLVTACLYLGKPFLFPLALSVLLAFLLAPVAERFEAWNFSRGAAVLVVTALAAALIGLCLYVIAAQVVDLFHSLPRYIDNLRPKIFAPVNHVSSVFTDMLKSFQPAEQTAPGKGPLPVEVVGGQLTALGVIREVVGPLFAPLGTAAVVIVNVIFFLYDRKGLRDRFIYLIGRGRLNVTTQAIDDAADRVSRYLGAQLMVNTAYGIPIGVGLYFIGIPNAALWGLLAIVLRFIPYLGAWIAASFPMVLALASSPSWIPAGETLGLFIGIELLLTNFVEPWLYGNRTGVAPSAIIVAAIFWTWIWGAGGLLLATPLTVCLAVLGRYVPALTFLDILLGNRPPIAPEHRFYQRLLAGDQTDVEEVLVEYLDRDAALEFFDGVALPALQLAEQDMRAGCLEQEEHRDVCRHLRDALARIDDFRLVDDDEIQKVVIVPARTECEALAAAMLSYLLRARGLPCTLFSERTLSSELHEQLAARPDAIVCFSALNLTAVRAAGSVFKRLGSSLTGTKLLGFWHGERAVAVERLNQPEIEVVTTLEEAVRLIVASTTRPTVPAA
jgi:predicted PurR-regulated permease PerM